MGKYNDIKVDFYLTFFEEVEGYDEQEVNGFWLIKQFDGNTKKWTVHLYSKESYKNYKKGRAKFLELKEQESLFLNALDKE